MAEEKKVTRLDMPKNWKSRAILLDELEALEAENKRLQCCGNCLHYHGMRTAEGNFYKCISRDYWGMKPYEKCEDGWTARETQ